MASFLTAEDASECAVSLQRTEKRPYRVIKDLFYQPDMGYITDYFVARDHDCYVGSIIGENLFTSNEERAVECVIALKAIDPAGDYKAMPRKQACSFFSNAWEIIKR